MELLQFVTAPPTMFTALNNNELEELWQLLSKAPADIYEAHGGCGYTPMGEDIGVIFWEVSVEIDFRDIS